MISFEASWKEGRLQGMSLKFGTPVLFVILYLIELL